MNLIKIGSIIWTAVLASTFSFAGSLENFYVHLVDRGNSVYAQFSDQGELGQGTVYLMTGDIFSLVGPSTPVKTNHFTVDAMIMSTNVELSLQARSPRIQSNFAKAIPESIRQKVQVAFSNKTTLKAVTEPLVVELGDFSPRYVCFLAMDKKNGNTYNDGEWQVNLDFKNITTGVSRCLDEFGKLNVKTVAIPLLGSSINPLIERIQYIEAANHRDEHIQRRVKSLKGIVNGIVNSSYRFDEVGIVVWGDDVQRIQNPKRKGDLELPVEIGGYADFRYQMLKTFASTMQPPSNKLQSPQTTFDN